VLRTANARTARIVLVLFFITATKGNGERILTGTSLRSEEEYVFMADGEVGSWLTSKRPDKGGHPAKNGPTGGPLRFCGKRHYRRLPLPSCLSMPLNAEICVGDTSFSLTVVLNESAH
jgi:hypothetical protein